MQDASGIFGDKVVYQIYIRSFNDSNGDGIGDLAGITKRLDYLQSLGVDCLWITPFFVSPQNDNGYDVADYRAVDPLFGTMDDLDTLLREAGERGIGLMLDMVFNHTSTSHEWFRRALAGDPKYLAYYKFVDAAPGATADCPGEPPTNWTSKFGGSAWEYVPSLGKWYLHLFDVSQADLNWDNPEVRAELADVVRFWKAKGVSGFRFDVVNLISKPAELCDDLEGDGHRFYTDGPRVHEFLQELVREGNIEDMVTVGEMSSTSIENCVRYTRPDCHELTQVFSFHHLKVDYADGDKWALKEPDVARLHEVLREWQEAMASEGGWNALFWSNHDQPRPNSRFGDVTTTESWLRSSKMLALCAHLLRGTPYIYQGEELGMTNPTFSSIGQYRDVESKNYFRILQERGMSAVEALRVVGARSRDGARTPMQWDASETAGFTGGVPWIGIPTNHLMINAEREMADRSSVWFFYKALIALRKAEPVIQRGSVHFLDALSQKVIAYERVLGGCRVVVACNFSDAPQRALCLGGSSEEIEGEVLVHNCDDWHVRGGELVLGPWAAVALMCR